MGRPSRILPSNPPMKVPKLEPVSTVPSPTDPAVMQDILSALDSHMAQASSVTPSRQDYMVPAQSQGTVTSGADGLAQNYNGPGRRRQRKGQGQGHDGCVQGQAYSEQSFVQPATNVDTQVTSTIVSQQVDNYAIEITVSEFADSSTVPPASNHVQATSTSTEVAPAQVSPNSLHSTTGMHTNRNSQHLLTNIPDQSTECSTLATVSPVGHGGKPQQHSTAPTMLASGSPRNTSQTSTPVMSPRNVLIPGSQHSTVGSSPSTSPAYSPSAAAAAAAAATALTSPHNALLPSSSEPLEVELVEQNSPGMEAFIKTILEQTTSDDKNYGIEQLTKDVHEQKAIHSKMFAQSQVIDTYESALSRINNIFDTALKATEIGNYYIYGSRIEEAMRKQQTKEEPFISGSPSSVIDLPGVNTEYWSVPIEGDTDILTAKTGAVIGLLVMGYELFMNRIAEAYKECEKMIVSSL